MDIPWCTIGDFNMKKIFEFISMIEVCGLVDLGYTGPPFTWCNQRATQARVWKRLDRSMVNNKWLEVMPQTTIEHLPSVGSDHSPLLMEMIRKNESHTKYFKILQCWVDNDNFMKTVQDCRDREVTGIEETIRKAEEELLTNNTEDCRKQLHLMNANYIRFLKLEESILKQKTQLQCFKEGDANTKYFHALMRGRRGRLFLHKICTDDNVWIQGDDQIAQEMPTLEELKQVVFAMNPNSAPGPDGIGGKFYQACWNIIKKDLLAAVQSFFCGHIMPKFMSHACLVLVPKIEQPNRFTDLRPISLNNFSNKIISKLLSMRLANILPLLRSENQSGFVRGRSITENIMLAQEITHRIKRPKEGDNVVIKLDMTKAYDIVSWSFTSLVLRRFGFGEFFIDLIWRIMSNNWYSIIINGHRYGFFHSTRGLKHGFSMESKGPQINLLSFADDVIVFTSTDRQSMKLIMDTLEEYEHTSDQLINKEKSHLMVPTNTPQDIITIIQEVTGFYQKDSPITYLGCPIYIGRQRIIFYSQLVDKVSKKICGW
ncbi:uncharacterized protein LOC125868520 [Solanum stenotomum]|uniref:uncharacterized protein LOC125868520 n=1 Tax=Solanum stenotomum TaxID=172797 RepID=UPI0020D0B4EE|nr:uncharacterized protein LOC125868520 [Solanum stenotomum]